jgi:hypothetical protein
MEMKGRILSYYSFLTESIKMKKIDGEVLDFNSGNLPAEFIISNKLDKLKYSFKTTYEVRGNILDKSSNSWLNYTKYFSDEINALRYMKKMSQLHPIASIIMIQKKERYLYSYH